MSKYIYLIVRADTCTDVEEVLCAFIDESKAHKYKEKTKTFKGTYLFVEPIEIRDWEAK